MSARGRVACVAWLLGAVACNRIDYPAGPLPTAPPLPPLAEPQRSSASGHAVLFLLSERLAVPLFCHDHGQRRFGADCAALLPTGSEARLTSGAVATLQPAGSSRCTVAGRPAPAFALIGLGGADDGATLTAALWSDAGYPVLFSPPVPIELLPETPSQLRGWKAACRQLGQQLVGTALGVRPVSTWFVDLDGDGVRERLDEVHCLDGASQKVTAKVQLLTEGRHPERTVPLRVSAASSTVVRIDMVSDVDANGVPEVMVRTVGDSEARIELTQLKNGGLLTMIEARCPTTSRSSR
jgi:hypothetical protein